MKHKKVINFKSLAIVMFLSLLFSFLCVSITESYVCGRSLGECMYLYAVVGYLEVAGGYILLLLLLYGINYFVKRDILLFVINIIMLFVIWASVFSCMEVWIPIIFSSKCVQDNFFYIYIPPFNTKTICFLYYIYKVIQDNKQYHKAVVDGGFTQRKT